MLATEADVTRTLKGTFTLARIYAVCAMNTDITRDGGLDPVPGHAGDLRWKRRVRGDLETMRRKGLGDRIARTTWVLQGTPQRPERMLLVVAGATPLEFELSLQAAIDLLAELDTPADLVLADPPYALGRGEGRHFADGNGYRRDHRNVVAGYVDVDPLLYGDFTAAWVTAAARALRRGGQLAVVTGPQRTGTVQCAAEAAGLTWVSTIAAGRQFPLRTTRRPSVAHWDVSILTRGALTHPRRVFNPPQDLPRAASGDLYPRDWWPAEFNGRADRPGLLRYDNALPERLALRIVRMLTHPGEHVVVPFLGSGTEAIACWKTGRRFTGADVNPGSLRFTSARLLDEHAWPADVQPALFPT
jgi:DNA modification methylase